MPGWSNSDNKFSVTPFIVGQTLGDGCNYDSVQTAIDDCFAAGGGVVGIRSSTTPYVENLTLRAGVDLYGFDVDGRLPSPISKVVIQGNHTFAVATPFGAQLSQYITFSALAGDAITVQAAGGSQAILAMKFCGIEAFTNPGQRCVVLDATVGGGCQFSTDNTNVNSSGNCFEGIGAGSQSVFYSLGNANSQSGNIYEATAGSNSLACEYTSINGALHIFNGVVGGNFDAEYSDLFSAQETALFPAGTGSFNVLHCLISSSAASGFWVDGIAGASVNFGDVLLSGSAQTINPVLSIGKINWQPYSESGTAPGVGIPRGTSAFDSNDFSVTDGFVSLPGSVSGPITQLSGDSGIATPTLGNVNIYGNSGCKTIASGDTLTIQAVGFSEQAVSFLAEQDEGYWIDTGVVATLPTSAIIDGTEIQIAANAAGAVIQADITHTIRVGNQVSSAGGTATSSQPGDVLVLRYRASAFQWWATSVIGNWILA